MSESDGGGADPSDFHEHLDEVATDLDAAETEADLDAIEETLDGIEADLEEAELPEPPEPEDEDEEAPPDPREELEDRLGELRDRLTEQRGPYAEEAIEAIEETRATVETTEWATEGVEELREVVHDFREAVADALAVDLERPPRANVESVLAVLDDAAEAVTAAELDPDEDAETIGGLLEATEALSTGIDDATAFGDLPVREQLNRRGFFEPLAHYKDFPPEWSAIKAHEEAGNVEMILLAFDLLDSNFLEEHCVHSLRRLGDERALEAMSSLAQRRDKAAIEVLGKIGSDEPLEMLLEYVETDSDPLLQHVSLTAVGEIGSTEATEAVAQQLVAEDDRVRSAAARSLGMIGDPRAIDPLSTVLEDADAPESVRGSAAWALVEIGTVAALERVEPFAEDRSYLVEAEAAKIAAAVNPG